MYEAEIIQPLYKGTLHCYQTYPLNDKADNVILLQPSTDSSLIRPVTYCPFLVGVAFHFFTRSLIKGNGVNKLQAVCTI